MSSPSPVRNATVEVPAFEGCSAITGAMGKVKTSIPAQSGRCYGVLEGQTSDVFGGEFPLSTSSPD